MSKKTGKKRYSLGRSFIEECADLWYSFVRLLYPKTCVVCGDTLVRGENFICSGCLADFPYDHGDNEDLHEILGDYPVDAIHSLFRYNKSSDYRRLIYALKYQSKRKLGEVLGEMLGDKIGDDTSIDLIIPVPLHPRRLKDRGYNQANVIAQGVSGALNIEVDENTLIRIKNNPTQTGLSSEERFDNVKDIFSLVGKENLTGKHILLVDDVITTGSTVSSCIEILTRVPEVKITVACLARSFTI